MNRHSHSARVRTSACNGRVFALVGAASAPQQTNLKLSTERALNFASAMQSNFGAVKIAIIIDGACRDYDEAR